MTSKRDSESSSRHRLFHAMVLMGGTLALRCGGEASTSGGITTGGNAAATGGTASTSGGNAAATGGTASTSGGNASGGAATGGGISVPGTGGSAPLDCPPTQWSCTNSPPRCYGNGYYVPDDCKCDPTRPVDAAACGVGQSLVCRDGKVSSTSQILAEPVAFECSCVANQLACGLACDAVFPNSGSCSVEETDTGLRKILCNCAVIVLR